MTQEERNFSESTAQEIDAEIKRLIEEANEEAMAILEKNRTCLNRIAETLLEKEVMQGEDLDKLLKEVLGEVPEMSSDAGPLPDISSLAKTEPGESEETSAA